MARRKEGKEKETNLISSKFCSSKSARRLRSRPRSVGGTLVPHVVSKACRAALTALSTSSTEAVSTVARCSPVAGL